MDEDILTEEELKRAVQSIFRLSQTDAEFRAICLRNPNEAIQRITGKTVAPGTRIEFLGSVPDKATDPGGAGK